MKKQNSVGRLEQICLITELTKKTPKVEPMKDLGAFFQKTKQVRKVNYFIFLDHETKKAITGKS